MDKVLAPGITKAGEGIDNISWNILGQTYVPKTMSETAFAWHATFPPETFVPPHIHPTQDEFIYMFEGQLELMLDGRTNFANPGDLVRMPMGLPHAIFNKSGRAVKCMFWVTPTRRLYDLFWAIHNMAEQTPAEVVALSAKHEVDFLPPPDATKWQDPMKAIIAGAGVGGLALALMLHRRGIEAVVYEQAPEIREVGVGINILPHAIKELAALGLLPALDEVGIRTKELHYISRLGQKVWSEPRGTDAGFDYPQFSIHRGRLQKVIYEAVLAELGRDAVRTGLRLQGFLQNEGGVVAHFTDSKFGLGSETVRGDVLIGADGIHSIVRRHFYPGQGRPSWQGLMLWRGAIDWPKFLSGRSMYIAGGMSAKIALYPIGLGSTPERRLTNWAIVSRIADGAITPAPADSWSRVGRMDEVIPYARRFTVPDVDVEALVRATPVSWEYPMCDRDPLPNWSFGRVTLMGDAAHPMYPVGSNGAAQALLDARCLADWLRKAEHPMQALHEYELERLPKTAEIVRLNRLGGPERVIDEVEKRAPAGFEHVDRVLSQSEREAIVRGYAGKAGFTPSQVNK